MAAWVYQDKEDAYPSREPQTPNQIRDVQICWRCKIVNPDLQFKYILADKYIDIEIDNDVDMGIWLHVNDGGLTKASNNEWCYGVRLKVDVEGSMYSEMIWGIGYVRMINETEALCSDSGEIVHNPSQGHGIPDSNIFGDDGNVYSRTPQ